MAASVRTKPAPLVAEGPDIAPRKNIADEFVGSMGGEATTGTTGYGSGFGKTF
jgi:hypothetical protein